MPYECTVGWPRRTVVLDLSQLATTDPGLLATSETAPNGSISFGPTDPTITHFFMTDLITTSFSYFSVPVGEAGGEIVHSTINSTTTSAVPESLERAADRIFHAAGDEQFEDGVESVFSTHLVALVRAHGDLAMSAINRVIFGTPTANPETASEAMRWLGHLADSRTLLYRLWVLRQGLKSRSARVRDGAGLGLSFLGDPRAIPDIEQAIARETIVELRSDLEEVLVWLRGSNGAPVTESGAQS